MPVTSTLAQGQSWMIVNNSSGAVTINSSGGNAIQVLAANTSAIVTCQLTSGTSAASWNATYISDAGGSVSVGTINQVAFYAAAGDVVSGVGPGSAGQLFQSNGAGSPPAYTTATYPTTAGTTGTVIRSDGTNLVNSTAVFADTYAVSTLLYASSSNAVSGLATANSAALVTNGSGVPAWQSLSAGQVLVGTTSGAPTATAISSGTNITVANGSGTITVNVSGVISPTLGGTGVNNGSNTLTLAGNLATSGAFASTFTMTGATSVTFPTSGTLATTAGTVSSVSGTTNRITSTGGTTPVIDISASYVGQSSITTLGTIGTGVWQGTLVGPTYGGTGVNNGANTLTLAGTLATAGAFASTFTMTGATAVTFPTSGTLATTSAPTTWTPAATFATPGDLSVAYTARSGSYSKVGNLVTVNWYLYFTPTYTTASGSFEITGIPFSIYDTGYGACINETATVVYPVGSNYLVTVANGGTSILTVYAAGTGVAGNTLTTAHLTSGVLYLLTGTVTYLTP
jgi:hypothetical protein